MGNVNIFHDALSFNTKEGGSNGGLSIHANGAGGGLKMGLTYINVSGASADEVVFTSISNEPLAYFAWADNSAGGGKTKAQFTPFWDTSLTAMTNTVFEDYESVKDALARYVISIYIQSSNAKNYSSSPSPVYDSTAKTFTIKKPSSSFPFVAGGWHIVYFY